jgi:hypothetical protein
VSGSGWDGDWWVEGVNVGILLFGANEGVGDENRMAGPWVVSRDNRGEAGMVEPTFITLTIL